MDDEARIRLDHDSVELPYTQDSSGLHVTLPATQPCPAIAYALKISRRGAAPAPTPTIDGSR